MPLKRAVVSVASIFQGVLAFGAFVVFVALLFSSQLALAQFTQQGPKLVGSGAVGPNAAEQGYSVSLSADGNTAIVGGPSLARRFWRMGPDQGSQGARPLTGCPTKPKRAGLPTTAE